MAGFIEYFPEDTSLEQYIRLLADQMGLRDWKIVLDEEAPEDECAGQCRVTYGRKIAHIRIAEHDTIEELRETIVHELIHCHLDCTDLPLANIRNTLGQSLYDATDASHTDYIEQAVDGMARHWAALLPLPQCQDEAA